MNIIPAEMWDSDYIVDQLISEYDDTAMPIPDIEFEPHLLISKVRKHYMEYIIKLLSVNYENNQKLLNKNIYLPSAIWRCAKNIETKAAQTCMVVQLYRKNIVAVITELKNDTKKGKLNKKLYECLHRSPNNEKNVQTTLVMSKNCNCQCDCNLRKKRRKMSECQMLEISNISNEFQSSEKSEDFGEENKIPVIINSNLETNKTATEQPLLIPVSDMKNHLNSNFPPKTPSRMSVESQDSDELMIQLEKLFQEDPNDDDLFDGALCDITDNTLDENVKKMQTESSKGSEVNNQEMAIESHAAQIKSLDERLASLAGLLANTTDNTSSQQKPEAPKNKKISSSKWLCEEYFQKSNFLELLDQIGDTNRKKLARIKATLLELFGADSDDEGVVSPLDETPEFIVSCKERIAPWVVRILTPYYIKGRIRGKALFKSLAKHLIRLIYQCSRYPSEYEVHSFVSDFLENHKLIRCEADFKEFRIKNI